MKILRLGTLALLLPLLAACAGAPKTLYNWDQYQSAVHHYLKGEGATPEEQVAALEANLQQANAKGAALPPGFHAHLGMLYAQLGRDDQVRQQFETEKRLFPESATFMDFLLRQQKGAAR